MAIVLFVATSLVAYSEQKFLKSHVPYSSENTQHVTRFFYSNFFYLLHAFYYIIRHMNTNE